MEPRMIPYRPRLRATSTDANSPESCQNHAARYARPREVQSAPASAPMNAYFTIRFCASDRSSWCVPR